LKSLFIKLGRALLAGTTSLWHSRQQAILELDAHMKLYPHPFYVPPDYLYPSPESLSSLSSHVLQELRSLIIAPIVFSIPRPTPSTRARLKVTLPSLATSSSSPPSPTSFPSSSPLPSPTARSSAPPAIPLSTTGLGILAYLPSSIIQEAAVPTAPGTALLAPTAPASRPKQKKASSSI